MVYSWRSREFGKKRCSVYVFVSLSDQFVAVGSTPVIHPFAFLKLKEPGSRAGSFNLAGGEEETSTLALPAN